MLISSKNSHDSTYKSNFNIFKKSISKINNSYSLIPPILAKSLLHSLKSSLNLLAITTATKKTLFKKLMNIRLTKSILKGRLTKSFYINPS